MQAKATLEALIDAVLEKLRSLPTAGNRKKPPLLIKIAPDLNEEDVTDVVDVLLERYVVKNLRWIYFFALPLS